MSTLTAPEFNRFGPPFRRWWGFYSPARGDHFGFRFYKGTLGSWSSGAYGRDWWEFKRSPAVDDLTRLVLKHWRGGRVLILPNGFVIKPLQGDAERGVRVIIGRLRGPKSVISPDGYVLDMKNLRCVVPGGLWPGPRTIGLECIMSRDGSLECAWSHPETYGLSTIRDRIDGPNPELATGFQKARPGIGAGRVRITLHGHIITNRERNSGVWETLYVGRMKGWPHKQEWIGEVYDESN